LLASVTIAYAQSDVQMSNHLFSQSYYNPAASGASVYGNINLLARHQFLGFEGAPTTALLCADALAPSINSGFGITLNYDVYGPLVSYNAMINYAYHLTTGNQQDLSLGVGAGVQMRQYDASRNIYPDKGDPTEHYDKDTHWAPDVNFGIEYRLRHWMIGASLTHLQRYFLSSDLRFPSVNYYLYTRYDFEVGRYWDIIPGITAHAVHTHQPQNNVATVNCELNLLFEYTKLFWFGASYRMSDLFLAESIVPMVGFNIGQYVRLGYAYDYNLTQLNQYGKGTHELLLTFRFKTKADSNQIPRFANL